VNKSELIEAVAEQADLPKTSVSKVLDAFLETVSATLASGEEIALVGFGTFTVKDRPERQGRNPATGQPMTIAAARVPSFRPGKALKETVNTAALEAEGA
jgi:DNA-binding protein HU-beta